MARFNYVTLVGKEVEVKIIQDKSFKGKVKQVFDDVVILESERGDIILKKQDIVSIVIWYGL